MAVTLFSYGATDNIPLECVAYLCADADGATGEDFSLWLNGSPSGATLMLDCSTLGIPGYDGLYQTNHAKFGTTGTVTYNVYDNTAATIVGNTLVLTWISIGPACPYYAPVPAPVLTATPVFNPTGGLNNVELDWTASVSIDSRFLTVRYNVQKKVGAGAYSQIASLYDTLTYTDVGVAVGGTYTYRIVDLEPIINDGLISNEVTITSMAEVGPPSAVATVASWGVLAQ